MALSQSIQDVLSQARKALDLSRATAMKRVAADAAVRGGSIDYPATELAKQEEASLGTLAASLAQQEYQGNQQSQLADQIAKANKPSWWQNLLGATSSLAPTAASLYGINQGSKMTSALTKALSGGGAPAAAAAGGSSFPYADLLSTSGNPALTGTSVGAPAAANPMAGWGSFNPATASPGISPTADLAGAPQYASAGVGDAGGAVGSPSALASAGPYAALAAMLYGHSQANRDAGRSGIAGTGFSPTDALSLPWTATRDVLQSVGLGGVPKAIESGVSSIGDALGGVFGFGHKSPQNIGSTDLSGLEGEMIPGSSRTRGSGYHSQSAYADFVGNASGREPSQQLLDALSGMEGSDQNRSDVSNLERSIIRSGAKDYKGMPVYSGKFLPNKKYQWASGNTNPNLDIAPTGYASIA